MRMHDAWHIYQDGSNWWRWERLDRKHKVLAHSMVAFETRDECLKTRNTMAIQASTAHQWITALTN
jgi:hypothetical protein